MLSTLFISAALFSGLTDGRKLVFDEEFSRSKSIDLTRWIIDDRRGFNDELEKYTTASENSALADGKLVITARKANGAVTSAMLETKQAWKYGYFEIRAKVPTGRGTWPAIWLLNDNIRKGTAFWPGAGEIDIMENVGFDPSNFVFSVHCAKYNWTNGTQRSKAVSSPTATTDFHVFGLDWKPDTIVFYLDGTPVYTVDRNGDGQDGWPSNAPFYLILDLAIGGNWGGRKGVDDSIFPSKFAIDYVKIYQ
ncbi:MAG TPA: glycoside hydrolase family 16 protein [Fimbriimonadaceae bacterium]|jgi:beta-glucanase (GH16 family)